MRAAATSVRRRRRAGQTGWNLVGIAVLVVMVFPVYWMVTTAFKPDSEINSQSPSWFPLDATFSHFREAITGADHPYFWNAVVNSLIIAGASTAIVMLVSVPAAYYTARHNFHGKRAFLYAVLVTQMFAPVALVIGIFREVNTINGAVNSYWAIIAVNAAFNLAFSIWILNGYLASIPTEIEDAALVDGAGPLRKMLRIVLPLARPGLVTAVIFTFIQVWNEFVVAETIFNDPTSNRETLTVGINAFVGLYQTQYQYLFVASIIGVVPVVLLFATIERYLVGGLTAGSIR